MLIADLIDIKLANEFSNQHFAFSSVEAY